MEFFHSKLVPTSELEFNFVRAGGPGGQNVNKLATKAVVHWRVGASRVFSPEQKVRLEARLKNRLNAKGELVVSASAERSQAQNRAAATRRLNELVQKALLVKKPRRPTRPTKAARLRRLESKRQRSLLKKSRKIFE